jgi:Flp pilus assembly protein TadG
VAIIPESRGDGALQAFDREGRKMRRIPKRFRQFLADESGDIMVLGAVGLVAIIAFAGLAIDVGQLRLDKRRMQAAVDAAAMAGALEISNCGSTHACTNMQTAAKQALIENGYSSSDITVVTQCGTSSATPIILTINNGPCALGSKTSDPNYGDSSYVEAQLKMTQGMTFARVIGVSSIPISVRSEAGSGSPSYCVYTSTKNQGTSGPTGVLLNGGNFTASCGIMDDSGSSNALTTNSGGTISATSFNVHGGWSPNNGGTFPQATPSTNVSAVSDPFSYLSPPSQGTVQQQYNYSPGGSVTLNPGAYMGGININSGVSVTLNPGTYYMGGSINDGGTLTGTGVTIYFASGSITMNSGSTAQLSAPTSGTYKGVLFYQNPSDSTSMIIDGNSTAKYEGAIYAPGAQLTLNSAGNTAAYTFLDVYNIIINSSSKFTIGNDYSSLSGGAPISGGGAALVE